VTLFQERLIFFPGTPPHDDPCALGCASRASRSSRLETQLDAWWIRPSIPRAAAIVFHGNAGSIGTRLELARLLHALDLSVLLFDYSGLRPQLRARPSVAQALADGRRSLGLARTAQRRARAAAPLVG
jgi:hypothetical protein